MRRRSLMFLGFVCLAVPLAAATGAAPRAERPASLPRYQADSLLPYQPEQRVSGTIRVWGNDRMQTLMARWQEGFRTHHPAARFEIRLLGTGTAVAGLYTGVADVALMGRPVDPTESMAFEWVFRYKPFGIEATTGSLAVPGKSFAPVVFVHRDNPIERLTLAQLDAVFGCEHLRGPKIARTWGDLGLTGEWSGRPIHAYGPDIRSATAVFFRQLVLKGSYKWSCDMKELTDRRALGGSLGGGSLGGSLVDADREVVDTLANDREGIAYSALGYQDPQVKPLALALEEGGPYYAPTIDTVRTRTYPLSRATWIVVNRSPDRPLDPKIKEFLRYVLSRDGQQDVAREGDYLPLPSSVVVDQLRRLR